MNDSMRDEDAGLLAFLCAEQGGAVLDMVYARAVGLCALAGAVRADRLFHHVSGDDATKRTALGHLLDAEALRELTPEGTEPDQRVYVLG